MSTKPLNLSIGSARLRVEVATIITVLLLLAVTALLICAGLMSGTIRLSAGQIVEVLTGVSTESRTIKIVTSIRLPRVVTAVAVGMALGAAGCVFQSVTRNSLGSPDIIGFTTGAATGAIVHIVLFEGSGSLIPVAAVVSGILTALAVYFLSRSGRVTGGYRLVLVGIGVSAFLSAVNALILARGDLDLAVKGRLWLSGSLNARTWDDAIPVAVAVVVLVPFLSVCARHLNIAEMGDDQANQLGVQTEHLRVYVMVAGVVLTAAAAAAAGPIAFIALASPQIARRLTRATRVQVVCSAIMGAVLLLSADLLSVNLPVKMGLPVGLVTGALGGVYLLWVLTRSRSL